MRLVYIDRFSEESKLANGWLIIKALDRLGHSILSLKQAQEGRNYDMMLVIRGEWENPLELKGINPSKPVVLWNWEPPGMPYLTKEKLDGYDKIFCSSHENRNYTQALTKTPCSLLIQPIDPEIYKPLDIERDIDIVFTGSFSTIRYNWLWGIKQLLKIKIGVYGNGWGSSVKEVYREELNFELNRAKMLLELPMWSSPNFKGTEITGTHYSLRLLVYLATNRPVLLPKNKDFDSLWTLKDYFTYSDLPNCIEKIKLLLSRDNLSMCSNVEILQNYTYEEQLKKLIGESL